MYKISNTHKARGSYQEDRNQAARLGISHAEEEDKRVSSNRFRALPPRPRSPHPSAPGPASAAGAQPLPASRAEGKALFRRRWASAQHLSHLPESSSSPGSAPCGSTPPHPGLTTATPQPLSPPAFPPPRLRGLKEKEAEGAEPKPEEPRGSGAEPTAGKGGASWEDLKAQAATLASPEAGEGVAEVVRCLCAAPEAASAAVRD